MSFSQRPNRFMFSSHTNCLCSLSLRARTCQALYYLKYLTAPRESSQRKAELLQTSSLGKECSRGDLDTWLPGTVSRGELKEAGIVPYFNIIALWLLWESIHWPSDRASHSVSKREACDLGDRYDILMRERWVLMGEEEEPSGVSQGQGSECGMWWQVTTQFSHSETALRRMTWPFWTLASQSFSIKPSRMIPMRKHLCELLYT